MSREPFASLTQHTYLVCERSGVRAEAHGHGCHWELPSRYNLSPATPTAPHGGMPRSGREAAPVACFSFTERRAKRGGMPGGEEVGRLFDRGRRAVSVGALLARSLIAVEGLALVTIAPEIAGTPGVRGTDWALGSPETSKAGRTRALRPGLWGRARAFPARDLTKRRRGCRGGFARG